MQMERQAMSFAAVTPENSQRVLMNDNHGVAPPEEWICAKGSMAAWWCIKSYAKKHGIDRQRVGYACRPLMKKEPT
jgi:hypothetical protein